MLQAQQLPARINLLAPSPRTLLVSTMRASRHSAQGPHEPQRNNYQSATKRHKSPSNRITPTYPNTPLPLPLHHPKSTNLHPIEVETGNPLAHIITKALRNGISATAALHRNLKMIYSRGFTRNPNCKKQRTPVQQTTSSSKSSEIPAGESKTGLLVRHRAR